MPKQAPPTEVIVDRIELICNGCRAVRTYPIPERIRGADALIEWMKTKPTRCACGSDSCDVKARLVNPS